jgi:hypothetical protein
MDVDPTCEINVQPTEAVRFFSFPFFLVMGEAASWGGRELLPPPAGLGPLRMAE